MQLSRKWTCLLATAVALLSAGCTGTGRTEKQPKIAINQFMHHELLDEVARGLKDEFAAVGLPKNEAEGLVLKNANGDQSVALQINKQFVDEKVDVIVALGTPSAQSAVKLTKDIPIVFGAITDPVQAKIADSIDKPGGNKTGTSDRWPFEKQVALIRKIVPGAKTVGIILNPAESNTEASMSYIRPALSKEGLTGIEVPVASTSEVLGAAKSLVGRCDVFLVPGDNTVIAAFDAVVKTAISNKIPIIGGSEDLVKKGSIATYAGDYYQIGRTTGKIVTRILKEHAQPGLIPVAVAEEAALVVNEKAATSQGVSIPSGLLSKARRF